MLLSRGLTAHTSCCLFVFPVPVLAFLLGSPAELYRMSWTVVIAGEACHAVAVMLPFRKRVVCFCYIVNLAYAFTLSAFYAFVFVNMKRLVCDQPVCEVTAYYPAVNLRPSTYIKVVNPTYPVRDVLRKTGDKPLCLSLFLLLFIRFVHIHER